MKTEESFLTNLTKLYVLVALNKSPKHGYELMSDFLKITGKNLSAGQVYPLLNNMRRKGLVDVSVAYEGQRERKIYSLTDEGRKFRETVLGQLRDLLAYGGVSLS